MRHPCMRNYCELYSSQSPEASGGLPETLRTDGIKINTVHFKTVLHIVYHIGSIIPF